jgi:hypothetical protein
MAQLIINYPSKDVIYGEIEPNKRYNLKIFKNYLFDDEYHYFKEIKKTKNKINVQKPIFYYPGSGDDIITPLIIVDKLFENKNFKFIFQDKVDFFKNIKFTLNNLKIPFSKFKQGIKFYYNQKEIELIFNVKDVNKFIEPHYDIYYERRFRIMKEEVFNYEKTIYQNLNKQGIIISDSGFENLKQKKLLDNKLSSYGKMVFVIKEATF